MVLKDDNGRPLLNLRIAVTNRCNLRCQFCHMEGEQKHTKGTLELPASEILRIARIAIGLGISKVKLTGGEPLVRSDVINIVKGIAETPGISDLSMTTNGTLLSPLAEVLRANGLRRVNISLPTLDPKNYNQLTGGNLDNVLSGVRAAVQAGFNPVKINVLILKRTSEHDLLEIMQLARETRAILQLIELEPVNISEWYYAENHKALDHYESLLNQEAVKVEIRPYMQNRRIYHLPDMKVEVIHPTENADFCMHCTRLRVTSDGKLKPCLMRNDNLLDVAALIARGAGDREIVKMFELANQERQPFKTTIHGISQFNSSSQA